MKKLFIGLIGLILIGSGCVTIIDPENAVVTNESAEQNIAETQPMSETTGSETAELNQALLIACQETAGEFDENTRVCTCSSETTLDEESGECLTASGVPAGIRGQEILERQAAQTACVESGGTYNNDAQSCVCPTNQEVNEDNKCAIVADNGTTE
jgi:hypothetical protein